MAMPLDAEAAEQAEQLDDRPPARAGRVAGAVTLRSVLTALVLTIVSGFWIRETEIVALGVYITESVPTIPAVAAILIMFLANAALRRTRWSFSRGEMLFVFFFVCIATTAFSCGVARFFLALLTAPFYFAQTGNKLAEAQKYIPKWAAVHDPEAIRGLYESLRHTPIPWDVWVVPLLVWLGFFLLLFLAMLSMVALLHRPWIEKEKLNFPLVQLPLEITETQARGGIPAFFRNPVMWAGFSISFLFNAANILHAIWPSFPAIGRWVSLPAPATSPWDAFGAIALHYRPELIGFGYLVSKEISFSIWFTYLLERLLAVLMGSLAYREPGYPFEQEQSIGAYLGMAVLILYMARHQLAAVARAAFSSASPEMRRYRLAFWGFWLSSAGLLVFCRLIGIQWWVAAVYMGIVLAVALTYARLRAETGIPLIWMFPYGMPKTLLLSVFGTGPLAPGGDPATLTGLATLTFLSRGFPIAFSGYQVEALRAGHQVSERPRRMIGGLVLALVVGMLLAFVFHLTGYYRVGAQQVYGGIWGAGMAQIEYDSGINWAATPIPPNTPKVVAALSGFLVAALLQLLRTHLVGFPLHPLGYGAATSYGSLIWFPFFVVWLAKVIVLRLGGMRLFRKTLPGFLGFALGHFFTAGIVWGLLGATGRNLYEGYQVWFG